MIVFDLECSRGHIFEGWFKNLKAFEEQNAKELISCPYCEDTQIRRVISPVATKTSSQQDEQKDERYVDHAKLAGEIADYVNRNFDDVGTDFTKEALKMHYGVNDKRNIKGSATAEEEKVLKDEGIEFFKLPIPKISEEKKN